MDVRKEQLYLAVPAFLVALIAGYSLGNAPVQQFETELDAEINVSNPVADVEIDGRNLTVMHQDDDSGKFFVDVTGDGEPDRELELVRDGTVHQSTELVTLDGKTYFVYFRYSDDPGKSGDAWLRFYRAREA